jgi:hypothetical protein
LLTEPFALLVAFMSLLKKHNIRLEFSVLVASSKDTVYCIIKQFEEIGSVCVKRVSGGKHLMENALV